MKKQYSIIPIIIVISCLLVSCASNIQSGNSAMKTETSTTETIGMTENEAVPQRMINEEKAKEIVFKKLQSIQKEISEAGTFVFTEDSSYAFVGDLIGEINKYSTLPEYYMQLDSISDVDYINVNVNETDNAWIIEARVNTSWGEFDDALNFVWCFMVDLDTGELCRKVLVDSGSYY